MKIDTIRTKWAESELPQNTHILTYEDKCIIVDPCASVEAVMEVVQNKHVEAILITHAHFDHILNMDAYEIAFGCPIYMHETSKEFLHDPEMNVSKYFVHEIIFDAENIHYLKGKETLHIANLAIQAIHTPGHSIDSICYRVSSKEGDKIMFSGDTFFAKAVGRTDLKTGNPLTLISSLRHVMQFDFNEAYTGHMRATTKEEQKTNIPTWIKYIKAKLLEQRANKENKCGEDHNV